MRISKRQLRNIIKESSEWEFRRNRWDKFKQHMAREPEIYLGWVEKNGHVTPASSSVMATYFLEMGLEREHKIHKKLASEIGLDHEEVMREMKRQKNEQAVMMGESRMKLTKRQLQRIIKEALPSGGVPDVVGTITGVYGEQNRQLSDRLLDVWNTVSADTLQALGGSATWEEIADEVMASAPSDLVDEIDLLSFDQQDDLFQKTFGAGRRY